MNSSNYRVRRATLDDVAQLMALWKSMHFPVDELARRVTDFQVAEDGEGKVAGAGGLQIAERQGGGHSEGFPHLFLADPGGGRFFGRLHSPAAHQGFVWVFTPPPGPLSSPPRPGGRES